MGTYTAVEGSRFVQGVEKHAAKQVQLQRLQNEYHYSESGDIRQMKGLVDSLFFACYREVQYLDQWL